MAVAGPRKKKMRMTREERRAQIIDAALNLFAEKGFTGTRTREIAAEAGISETLIFQHFKNKETLYLEALNALFGPHPIQPEIEEAAKARDDEGVFRVLAGHIILHSHEDPRILRLTMFSGLEGLRLAGKTGEKKEDGAHGILSRYIRRRMDEGAFRPLDPDLAARLYLEMVMMYAADQALGLTGPPMKASNRTASALMANLFVVGLRAGAVKTPA